MQITTVSLNFNNTGIDNARIYFRNGDNGNTNLSYSGNLRISGQEYLQNTNMDDLERLVMNYMQDEVNNPNGTEEPEEPTGTLGTQSVNTQNDNTNDRIDNNNTTNNNTTARQAKVTRNK